MKSFDLVMDPLLIEEIPAGIVAAGICASLLMQRNAFCKCFSYARDIFSSIRKSFSYARESAGVSHGCIAQDKMKLVILC